MNISDREKQKEAIRIEVERLKQATRRMHGLPMVRRPRRRYGRRSKPPDGSGRGTEERNYINGE